MEIDNIAADDREQNEVKMEIDENQEEYEFEVENSELESRPQESSSRQVIQPSHSEIQLHSHEILILLL